MSDTPQTDALILSHIKEAKMHDNWLARLNQTIEFARQKERQVTAEKLKVALLRNALQVLLQDAFQCHTPATAQLVEEALLASEP